MYKLDIIKVKYTYEEKKKQIFRYVTDKSDDGTRRTTPTSSSIDTFIVALYICIELVKN